LGRIIKSKESIGSVRSEEVQKKKQNSCKNTCSTAPKKANLNPRNAILGTPRETSGKERKEDTSWGNEFLL